MLSTSLFECSSSSLIEFARGWDDLFNKCSENLNSLTAMKLSPYYKGEQRFTSDSCVCANMTKIIQSLRKRYFLHLEFHSPIVLMDSSGRLMGGKTQQDSRAFWYDLII